MFFEQITNTHCAVIISINEMELEHSESFETLAKLAIKTSASDASTNNMIKILYDDVGDCVEQTVKIAVNRLSGILPGFVLSNSPLGIEISFFCEKDHCGLGLMISNSPGSSGPPYKTWDCIYEHYSKIDIDDIINEDADYVYRDGKIYAVVEDEAEVFEDDDDECDDCDESFSPVQTKKMDNDENFPEHEKGCVENLIFSFSSFDSLFRACKNIPLISSSTLYKGYKRYILFIQNVPEALYQSVLYTLLEFGVEEDSLPEKRELILEYALENIKKCF